MDMVWILQTNFYNRVAIGEEQSVFGVKWRRDRLIPDGEINSFHIYILNEDKSFMC